MNGDALTAPQPWTTTDDVDLCAVLSQGLSEVVSWTGLDADRDAEQLIGWLRAHSYDVVPSPAFTPERYQPPF